MNDMHTLSHSTWNCKYHVVFAPKYRRKVFYGEKRYEIGQMLRKLCKWKGVNVLEAEACPDHIHMLVEIPPKITEYIQHQLEEDAASDQLTLDISDPFTGSK